MPDVIITYETLYEILRREKYRAELQKLDENFYRDVVKYVAEKRAILESQTKKESIFASTEVERTQVQIKNVLKILKELYEKRENKIVQFALFGSRSQNMQDTATMLPEEYELYKKIKGILDEFRENVLVSLLQNRLPSVALEVQKDLKIEEKTESLNIEMVRDVPEFVGPDLSIYGPFKKGEKHVIPSVVAEMLMRTEQAKHESS